LGRTEPPYQVRQRAQEDQQVVSTHLCLSTAVVRGRQDP
jgi:hypothetical protein